jgi:hypothetical protein
MDIAIREIRVRRSTIFWMTQLRGAKHRLA